ncbi:hypothetical protein F0562_028156 [Nyssa sinensis]|uniref:Uncharacterized protein n=1 Tax=Nyssa sinensis TaxID=561372 RepID=A0A5J5B798_9ASTE|nr:hypothetical protein F0562_028156 [Nyssa sinensis]
MVEEIEVAVAMAKEIEVAVAMAEKEIDEGGEVDSGGGDHKLLRWRRCRWWWWRSEVTTTTAKVVVVETEENDGGLLWSWANTHSNVFKHNKRKNEMNTKHAVTVIIFLTSPHRPSIASSSRRMKQENEAVKTVFFQKSVNTDFF